MLGHIKGHEFSGPDFAVEGLCLEGTQAVTGEAIGIPRQNAVDSFRKSKYRSMLRIFIAIAEQASPPTAKPQCRDI